MAGVITGSGSHEGKQLFTITVQVKAKLSDSIVHAKREIMTCMNKQLQQGSGSAAAAAADDDDVDIMEEVVSDDDGEAPKASGKQRPRQKGKQQQQQKGTKQGQKRKQEER